MEAKLQELSAMGLSELLQLLKEAREARDEARTVISILEEKFRECNADIYDTKARLDQEVSDLEAKVRDQAVTAFNETGSKEPSPGVKIALTTSYDYDPFTALDWAKEHQLCLKPALLDNKAFESLCKSDSTRPEFVGVIETPAARIATDLGKALGVDESINRHLDNLERKDFAGELS